MFAGSIGFTSTDGSTSLFSNSVGGWPVGSSAVQLANGLGVPLPAAIEFERPAGGARAIAEAARLLSSARFPVILSGAGVVLGDAMAECAALAERLDAPVCNNYQHNDSFPGSHPLSVGPLGYNGSRAGMD